MARSLGRQTAKALLRWNPTLKRWGRDFEQRVESVRHSAAEVAPWIIRPRYVRLMIAITAHCNARCIGCRYGRDFMPGSELPYDIVEQVLEDAAHAKFEFVRLYGGEPLLHPRVTDMVRKAFDLGLRPSVTTNAVLLGKRIDELYDAGLRQMTVGLYGIGDTYDRYTQTKGLFKCVERSIATVREKYGSEFTMQMNWLLMRPSCTPEALQEAIEFARRYDMSMQVDLIHYSLPYFQEGPDRCLQFREEDRPKIDRIVEDLLALKAEEPSRLSASPALIRSIPDWLLLGPDMKVPCTAGEMIWVGADGTTQLCYVTFPLGNVHDKRLREMLGTPEHIEAARNAFALKCPNCHCGSNDRILRHAPSRRKYSRRTT